MESESKTEDIEFSLDTMNGKCVPWDRFSQEQVDELEKPVKGLYELMALGRVIEDDEAMGELFFHYTTEAGIDHVAKFGWKGTGKTLGFLTAILDMMKQRIRDDTCDVCKTLTTPDERVKLEGVKEDLDSLVDMAKGIDPSTMLLILKMVTDGTFSSMEEAMGAIKLLAHPVVHTMESNGPPTDDMMKAIVEKVRRKSDGKATNP